MAGAGRHEQPGARVRSPAKAGAFRVSLTYDAPTGTGKSAAHTDTYHGHFVTLVPNEQVVEVFEFETADPALRGTMTMTTTLTERRRHGRPGGTRRTSRRCARRRHVPAASPAPA